MIEAHISKPRLMFENYPTFLVADTNCFVDHLDGLKAIVGCQDFTLVVPLIGKNVLKLLKIVSSAHSGMSGMIFTLCHNLNNS